MKSEKFTIRTATVADVPIILELIKALATYERAPDEVTTDEKGLAEVLFGKKPAAEVLIAFEDDKAVGFAVFFHNFSTWLGKPGLYLEDLFVGRRIAQKVMGAHCWFAWQKSLGIAVAAGWNGRCSIGMNRPLSFIKSLAQIPCMSGQFSD